MTSYFLQEAVGSLTYLFEAGIDAQFLLHGDPGLDALPHVKSILCVANGEALLCVLLLEDTVDLKKVRLTVRHHARAHICTFLARDLSVSTADCSSTGPEKQQSQDSEGGRDACKVGYKLGRSLLLDTTALCKRS